MKKYIILNLLVYSLYSASCKSQTTTPKEYINSYTVSKVQYGKDSLLLIDAIKNYYELMNKTVKSNQITEIQNIEIDSIFYGGNRKIACLALLTKKNNYSENGIQYAGECYIAYKNEKIDSIYKLKHSVTSVQSLENVSELIQSIYFRELNYISEENNINDKRFWGNHNWNDAIKEKEELKDFEETKKNHPENVYPR